VPDYQGEKSFSNTNVWRLEEYSFEAAVSAYDKFQID